MKGILRANPFGTLIAELGRANRTGILTLTRRDLRKQACFLRGMIRLAGSNLKAEGLIEYLRESGTLPAETLDRAAEAAAAGSRAGAALQAAGVTDAAALREAARAHILDLLLPCFDWADGAFTFAEGVPDIAGEVSVEVPPMEIVLERARRRQDRAALARLASGQDMLVVRAAGLADELERLPLTDQEKSLLASAARIPTVGQALTGCPGGPQRGLAALNALLEAGGLRLQAPAGSAAAPSTTAHAAAPSRDAAAADEQRQIRYYLDMLKRFEAASHYDILDVQPAASEEDIRRSYYQLAREVHPDRFTSPAMVSIRSEMERLFARITEAYNTLIDPLAREDYDKAYVSPTAPAAPLTTDSTPSPAELARRNYLAGRALHRQDKHREAMRFLKNAVSLDDSKADYFLLLGIVQATHPPLRGEALDSLLKAASLDPVRAEIHLELGRIYRKLNRDDDAERELREALRCDPSNVEAAEELQQAGTRGGGMLRGLFGKGKPG